ncbi:MAG: hypothetical protein AB7U43_05195 [Desulfobacter sp.]
MELKIANHWVQVTLSAALQAPCVGWVEERNPTLKTDENFMNGIWAENLYEHRWFDECAWLNLGFRCAQPNLHGDHMGWHRADGEWATQINE